MDYSKYRLKDHKEIDEYYHNVKGYSDFVKRVLERIEQTEEFDVSTIKDEHKEIFIKTVCFLIENGLTKKLFNAKFTKIR